MIAQYDTASNENEGLEVTVLPTVKFYSKKYPRGHDVKYGARNVVEDFKDFLAANSLKYQASL